MSFVAPGREPDMIEATVQRGKLLTVIVLILCVLGLSAAFRMPVQMIPNLDVSIIRVNTGWPGATPQDVEKEILIEQERYLRSLPNLARMESYANTGGASIELEFPFGVDVNEALIRVSNALSQVPSYPENVDQPRLYSSSFSENAFMYFAIMPMPGNPMGLDMDMATDFVDDNVRPRMERVQGVSQVDMNGGALKQIKIYVDPAKLALRDLKLTDIRDAIRNRNRDISAGDIDDGKRRYLLRTTGRFADVQALESLILRHEDGANLRLGDVATVELDHYEKRGTATVGGEASINLSVRREAGSNVIDIKREMLAVIDEMRVDLLEPNGLQMIMIGDDVRYVQASIRGVMINLLLGALLASAVMYLFLRSGRATLICLMGIPVCTISAFFGLMVFDRTINVISLAGIAFAIGMTVDNSIVVLESIEQARRRGLDRIEAAVAGVREVWSAVLASSSTTVLVFAPVLFIEQEAGQLYSDIAIAISASIIASMCFALLVVPTACAQFGLGNTATAASRARTRILELVASVSKTARIRTLTLLVCAFATVGLAIVFMPPAEYLPEGEEPKAFSRMIAPPGYNLSEMQVIGDEILELLEAAVAKTQDDYEGGEAEIPPLEYYFMRVSSGGVWVMSEPKEDAQINAMMNALTVIFESYPGMRAFSSRGSIISSNQGGTRAVNLNIAGPELGDLYDTARHAMRRAETLFGNPRINSSPASLSLDQPLIEIQPRWERLAETGFDAQSFGFTVAAYSDGAYVGEFIEGDDKVDMFLFSNSGNEQQLGALSGVPILTPSGQVVPLNALASLVETVDSDELRRVDGRRTVSLYIIPPPEIALETAVKQVQQVLVPELKANGEAGPNIDFSITGAADQLDATRASLLSNFAVALILIYLLLVAIFSHWGYPLLILTTVPLGLAGGIVGLVAVNGFGALLQWVGLGSLHQSFDMITMLGFVILLGTVVNNPILIVEQTRFYLQQGLSVVESVRCAVEKRLRPILMSTATTVFGLAPLVLIPGAGTELYRGVGIVVLMGIGCSMLITLSFLPCLLIVVFKLIQRRQDHARPA